MNMETKRLIFAVSCLAIAGSWLASCSSTDDLDNGGNAKSKANFTLYLDGPGFTEEQTSRASANAAPVRTILSDGLLVDATLESGNTTATRAAEHQPITTGNGIVILCETGGTAIAAEPQLAKNFTAATDAAQASIGFDVPDTTKSYDVYIYWAEGGGLTTSSSLISNATVGSDIGNVILSSRPVGAADDYGMVTISGSTKTGVVHLTPIGAKTVVSIEAGVSPFTAFTATIKSYGMSNVSFKKGTYQADPNSVGTVPIEFTGNNDGGTIYKVIATSNMSARYIPRTTSKVANDTAEVNILSITGPSGEIGTTNLATTTYDATKNTMKFAMVFQNGLKRTFNLKLATPIYGYVPVGTDGVGINEVYPDDTANYCVTGIPDATYNPQYKPQYSGAARWPALNGRPQFYEWDAKAPFPQNGVDPSTLVAPNSRANYDIGQYTSAVGTRSAKYLVSFKEMVWYISQGSYTAYGRRWYCPNGFFTGSGLDTKVYQGGLWFKRKDAIIASVQARGITDSNRNFGDNWAAYNCDSVFTAGDGYGSIPEPGGRDRLGVMGTPGVDKMKSGSRANGTAYSTNPNDWYFLPSTGCYAQYPLGYSWSNCRYWCNSSFAYDQGHRGCFLVSQLWNGNPGAITPGFYWEAKWRGLPLWLKQ